MKVDSAMMADAFKFLGDYNFHVERYDSWRGSSVRFQRERIALIVDFDTIALSSWLDLYGDKGENIAKIGLPEALKHTHGAPDPPRILFGESRDYRRGLEELASAVKAHLMPPLCNSQVFWELHSVVYGTK